MSWVDFDPVAITAQSYEDDAGPWHVAHRDEPRSASRRDSYERFTNLLSSGALVLDLGCGSGLDVQALAERGLSIVGLDLSAAMLRIARSVPAVAGRLLRGDMRSLPLATGSADAVWADGSLHHLPKEHLGGTLHEIVRVLRPGGALYTSVERGEFQGFVERQEGIAGRRWYAHYQTEELQSALGAVGFRIIDRIIGGRSAHSAGFVALFALI